MSHKQLHTASRSLCKQLVEHPNKGHLLLDKIGLKVHTVAGQQLLVGCKLLVG